MRPCQLCACASWGPIGDPSEIARMTEFALDLPADAYVRCDNCKAVARLDLVQDAPPSRDIPQPDADFGGFGAYLKPLVGAFMPAIPTPPTRTERLVYQILQANPRSSAKMKSSDYGQWTVALARLIEWELDHPTGPNASEVIKQPWLVLSFPAQEEFERWVTGLLDTAVWPGYNTGPADYSKELYERAVFYATKQQ